MDIKEIGLAAKDVVFGIGAAVAGAQGGPAAAQGVNSASSGLDRIVNAVAPSEQSRAQRFDRADFAARQPPQALPPASPPAVEQTAPPGGPAADSAPLLGDAKIAADYLSALGWSPEKLQSILQGPSNGKPDALAAIVGREAAGRRVVESGKGSPSVAGSRVAESSGAAVAAADGDAVSSVLGRALRAISGSAMVPVSGARVPDGGSSESG
ncbi:MAG: hypothetical protein U1A78_00150 [Polyangia bacterium]